MTPASPPPASRTGARFVSTAFVAFLLGAVSGAAALVLEGITYRRPPLAPASLAAYALLGGLLAVLARALVGHAFEASAGRIGAVASSLCFVGFSLLYLVNVHALPGEPYWTWRSLLADASIAALLVGLLLLSARSPLLHDLRERRRGLLVALSAAILLLSAGALASGWPRPQPPPRRSGPGPNLLLIVLDSARRDHMSLHGYPRPTSPALDAWAPRARVYEQAYAASSWTVPTVEWILRRAAGDASAKTLPSRLADSGYTTAAFTDNPHLVAGSRLLEGFDVVERSVGAWRWLFRGTLIGEFVERHDSGSDDRLVDRILEWKARGDANGPLLLYAHLMDSHTPYRGPAIDGRRRPGRHIEFPVSGMQMTAEEAEDIVARYDGGIRSASDEAARLLAAAEGWGRPFLAIATSDHGESMGEAGRWFHGTGLTPELLAVPLLAVGEGVEPGRVAGVVGQASIPKTLLAAAGLACEGCPGLDLRRTEAGVQAVGWLPPRYSYRVAEGFKLLLDSQTNRLTLFDVSADPLEQRDLAAALPELAERLSRDLRTGELPAITPEGSERLRALGYVDESGTH